jgi:hypothetical protein
MDIRLYMLQPYDNMCEQNTKFMHAFYMHHSLRSQPFEEPHSGEKSREICIVGKRGIERFLYVSFSPLPPLYIGGRGGEEVVAGNVGIKKGRDGAASHYGPPAAHLGPVRPFLTNGVADHPS